MENIAIQVTMRKDDGIVIDINNRCRHLEISAKIVCPFLPSHGVILFHIHSEKERWQHAVNLLKKTARPMSTAFVPYPCWHEGHSGSY